MAYADGEASPAVTQHIRACPSCAAEARQLARQQRAWQQRLFRFACPTPHTLGEYDLDLLPAAERLRIAQHVVDCPRCTEELRLLRTFLATEAAPRPAGLRRRVRELVATLLPAPGAEAAYAGLRGASDQTARTYAAGSYRLTVDLVPGGLSGRAARHVALTGLIWREGAALAPATAAEASLVHDEQTLHTTGVDELGNFAFDEVRPGRYRLEVTLGEERIVVAPLDAGA